MAWNFNTHFVIPVYVLLIAQPYQKLYKFCIFGFCLVDSHILFFYADVFQWKSHHSEGNRGGGFDNVIMSLTLKHSFLSKTVQWKLFESLLQRLRLQNTRAQPECYDSVHTTTKQCQSAVTSEFFCARAVTAHALQKIIFAIVNVIESLL